MAESPNGSLFLIVTVVGPIHSSFIIIIPVMIGLIGDEVDAFVVVVVQTEAEHLAAADLGEVVNAGEFQQRGDAISEAE